MRARRWTLGVVVVGALVSQGCLDVFGARPPEPAHGANARGFGRPCEAVWPAAVHALTARGFRLMARDPLSGVASFQWADAREFGRLRATGELEQFVVARTGLLNSVKDARIESAVVELSAKDAGCEASLRVSYAARSGALSLKRGWVRLESTGKFEENLLAAMAQHLGSAEPRHAKQQPVRGTRGLVALAAEPSISGGLPDAEQPSRSRAAANYSETQVVRLGIGN